MSSEKKWQNIIIADLLEQVQRIDKLIAMYILTLKSVLLHLKNMQSLILN